MKDNERVELSELPYFKRGEGLRNIIENATAYAWITWDELFARTDEEGYSRKTVQNTVNEGVAIGLYSKRGGKFDGGGVPTLTMTGLGYILWLVEFDAEKLRPSVEDSIDFCIHDHVLELCEECSEKTTPGASRSTGQAYEDEEG